jgi:hypothetical protein
MRNRDEEDQRTVDVAEGITAAVTVLDDVAGLAAGGGNSARPRA